MEEAAPPPQEPAVEDVEDVKAEEPAVPPAAAAGAPGVVLGPRMRKRTVNAEYVQVYDDELYASEDSEDGEPYQRGKHRRAGGGSTPAQRAKRVRRQRDGSAAATTAWRARACAGGGSASVAPTLCAVAEALAVPATQSKRETLEQSHEARVAHGVGFDPYMLRRAARRAARASPVSDAT